MTYTSEIATSSCFLPWALGIQIQKFHLSAYYGDSSPMFDTF
jgi:hypothetical protein